MLLAVVGGVGDPLVLLLAVAVVSRCSGAQVGGGA